MTLQESPAKINWFLNVLGKRGDGFHDIFSAIQKISLHDSLTFRKSDTIHIDCNWKIENNIILKAIEVLRDYRDTRDCGVTITLEKETPIAAGLGGGSSNAATSLRVLNSLWGLRLTDEELIRVSAKVGSDVPFFLFDTFSFVSGRGELLNQYTIVQSYDILLVNPGIEISAQWAYEKNKEYLPLKNKDKVIQDLVQALNKRDFDVMREYMKNVLEKPVFQQYPALRDIKTKLTQLGSKASLMSGSGSTIFGVFHNSEQALDAQKHFPDLWTRVVKTLKSKVSH